MCYSNIVGLTDSEGNQLAMYAIPDGMSIVYAHSEIGMAFNMINNTMDCTDINDVLSFIDTELLKHDIKRISFHNIKLDEII